MLGSQQGDQSVTMTIIVFYYVFFTIIVCTSASITMDQVAKCEPGDKVKNPCMTCVCTLSQTYSCQSKPCSRDHQEKVVLGKPTHARCEPKTIYVHKNLTCMCNSEGHWLNEKCDVLFKSLIFKRKSNKPPKKMYKELRCDPDSFFKKDCNVCKCSPEGEVARSRCTRNDCKRHFRRTADIFQGNCITGNWYSLAPCQFCYCQHSNKIVCSTGNPNTESLLELGTYKLSVCGKNLIEEMKGLVPDESALRIGNDKLLSTKPEIELTTESYLNPNDMTPVLTGDKLEYDMISSDKSINDTLQNNAISTISPATYNESESDYYAEDSEDERTLILETNTTGLNTATTDNINGAVEGESNGRASALSIEAKPLLIKQKDSQDLYNIDLPAVLDQIIHMALRKSMVKLDINSTCIPGSTERIDCNFCYCLTNGKLLCTYKKCGGKGGM